MAEVSRQILCAGRICSRAKSLKTVTDSRRWCGVFKLFAATVSSASLDYPLMGVGRIT